MFTLNGRIVQTSLAVSVSDCGSGVGMIRPACPTDCSAIAEIYNHYILHTTVTFEEEQLTAEQVCSFTLA